MQAAYQSLHHFVLKTDWSDKVLLAAVRTHVLPIIKQRGPIRGWMVNDIGTLKKGTHSVGIARQYCGQLGKQDNCQAVVTLSLAVDHASLLITYRLHLLQPWADDPARRTKAGVPDDVTFQTRPQIALAQTRAAIEAGVPTATVLADAGYRAAPRSTTVSPMSPVSRHQRAYGRQARSPCNPNHGTDVSGQPHWPAATPSTPDAAHPARGHQHHPGRTLCRRPRSPSQSRLQPPHTVTRRIVAGRIAERQAGAH